jgi:hypothetical protein
MVDEIDYLCMTVENKERALNWKSFQSLCLLLALS